MEKYVKALSPTPDRVGVMIKNQPGGAEMRAMNELYNSRPDGHTIASGGDILHTRAVFGELGFDLFDITFIARLSSASKVLVTGSRSNIRTWDDIVQASQKAPLRVGITGFGASNHVASILFIDTTRISARPVIFDGTAGANAALIRGDVPLGINSEDSLRNLINAKELRPILTFTEKSVYPGVPNIKEIGFPELIEPIKSQRYVIAPPKLPADKKKALEDILRKTMVDQEFLAWNKKAEMSFDPVFGPDLDNLVRNIQNFYQGKEKILREYLVEKKG
jgi:tripartite-type tricarboxylate transporter receptor subunit TctC